ncbi:MAG: PKD domain-containing protein [Terriglobales bacterium]
MMARKLQWLVLGLEVVAAASLLCPTTAEAQAAASLSNRSLHVAVHAQDGSFELWSAELRNPVLTARVGAEVNHQWIWSNKYPKHRTVPSNFQTIVGSGHQVEALFTGLPNQPDLKYTLRLYDDLTFGDIQVQVINTGREPISVQNIRVLDVIGEHLVDLNGPDASDRVLSDSYSEDRPPLHIFDLGKEPPYLGEDEFGKGSSDLHLAVGSQLIYNRKSKFSLFLAALTSDRWLTILRLKTAQGSWGKAQIASYEVDSTGTTEIMKKESLRGDPPSDHIELSLPVPAGGQLASEQVMFTAGQDYYAQLETYARAVRDLHHALVSKPAPWGWWSWTAYYFGLSQQTALSNAEWLSEHLKDLGFDFFHLDAGYSYADGEYTNANATLFPDGGEEFGHRVSQLGLKLALWTAPFRVSERAWVYQHHPEWLVHNTEGKPIQIGFVESSHDAIYVLDPTHPGAQEYLRYTYETLTRDWGARYFKLDFMDDTAIEGVHYRPNTTALEAERIGLQVIREAVGPTVYIDKDGSPMLNKVGLTDLGRLSTDTGHSFEGDKEDATGIAARYYMNGNFYGADPDAFTVAGQLITDQTWHQSKTPLTLDDAEVSITLAAIAGGMFELGDDLPTLGAEPDRVNLVQNRDLLDMVRLGRSSKPVDLMTYSAEDEQPSVFVLREDRRQAVLAVFNWTDSARSHQFKLSDLGLPGEHPYSPSDIFRKDRSVFLEHGLIEIENQAPHSVRLVKIVDTSVPAAAPSVSLKAPEQAQLGHMVELSAVVDPEGVPALRYHWDFGDGVSAHGPAVTHAYTRNGVYTVRVSVDGMDGIAATKTSSVPVTGNITTTYDVPGARRYEEHRTNQNP